MIKLVMTKDFNGIILLFGLTLRCFNIIIWSFNVFLSMILKDIIISVMNFIISLGMLLELLSDTKLEYLDIIYNSILIVIK